MAYFKDLSDYTYSVLGGRGAKTVGWLTRGHSFGTAPPREEDLDLLWLYGSISVAKMRGGHDCEFCQTGAARRAERNGVERLLGVAEIRVFSKDGKIYAAPSLIYHYIASHNYLPPDEFMRALRDGPRPPSGDYFEILDGLGLEWSTTPNLKNVTSEKGK